MPPKRKDRTVESGYLAPIGEVWICFMPGCVWFNRCIDNLNRHINTQDAHPEYEGDRSVQGIRRQAVSIPRAQASARRIAAVYGTSTRHPLTNQPAPSHQPTATNDNGHEDSSSAVNYSLKTRCAVVKELLAMAYDDSSTTLLSLQAIFPYIDSIPDHAEAGEQLYLDALKEIYCKISLKCCMITNEFARLCLENYDFTFSAMGYEMLDAAATVHGKNALKYNVVTEEHRANAHYASGQAFSNLAIYYGRTSAEGGLPDLDKANECFESSGREMLLAERAAGRRTQRREGQNGM